MQVVIDINDNEYRSIKSYPNNNTSYPITLHLYEAVRNGTPLPKGHGRLIDADALEQKMCDREKEIGDENVLWESSAVSVALDMFALTIIEKDKEGEE